MKSVVLSIVMTMAGTPLMALCNGPSFLDQMSADETAQMDTAVAATPYPEGRVWQATRAADVITIIGTIHVDTPTLPAIRDLVAPEVAAADLLLVEATAAEESQLLALFAENPELYLITEGPTLPDLLAPDLWATVKTAVEARQIPPFMVAQFQPWYLGLTLAIPPCATASIAAGVRGLDHMIMEDAEDAGVPVQALEPYDTIITALREDTMAAQIATLKASLPPLDLQDSLFVAMMDGYGTGDIAQMWEMSRVALAYLPDVDANVAEAMFREVEAKLIAQRNVAWIPVIEDAMRVHDNVVVAAGAAHLPGELGVLQLLSDGGWDVTLIAQ